MADIIERHADKLLREWEEIQQKEFWKLLSAGWDKLHKGAIEFTLSTNGYDSILRSRGTVDGIRQATNLPGRIAQDIRDGKQG